jgi:hypothetical protein
MTMRFSPCLLTKRPQLPISTFTVQLRSRDVFATTPAQMVGAFNPTIKEENELSIKESSVAALRIRRIVF